MQLSRNGGINPLASEDGAAIYYNSGSSIMKAAPDGSGETRIAEGVTSNFAVARDGVYFTAASGREIRFVGLAGGTSRLVRKPDKNASQPGLSPDGRWLLYTQIDGQSGSNLMLVENFH